MTKQCSSCGGFCGKVCERENVMTDYEILKQSEREGWRYAKECESEIKRLQELFGCAECANKGEDGWALYCLSCVDKMRVRLTEAQITDLLSKVSVDGSYAINLVRAVEIYHGVQDD